MSGVVARRRAHARQRAEQRFGVALTNSQLQAMARQIMDGKSAPVPAANRSLAVRCHVVRLPGLPEMAVLYDKTRKIVVTVLPNEGAEMQHYRAGQP